MVVVVVCVSLCTKCSSKNLVVVVLCIVDIDTVWRKASAKKVCIWYIHCIPNVNNTFVYFDLRLEL